MQVVRTVQCAFGTLARRVVSARTKAGLPSIQWSSIPTKGSLSQVCFDDCWPGICHPTIPGLVPEDRRFTMLTVCQNTQMNGYSCVLIPCTCRGPDGPHPCVGSDGQCVQLRAGARDWHCSAVADSGHGRQHDCGCQQPWHLLRVAHDARCAKSRAYE